MAPGDAAPGFVLPQIDPDGDLAATRSLADWHGKVVVVDFWATWCKPCVEALPDLARLDAELGERGDVVLVNLDDPRAARTIVDRAAPGLPLLYDASGVAHRYGVQVLPHTVVIDRDGRVRAVLRGGDGGDLRSIVTRLE
jgi:thiol-disulfide isomerase/thioredoxin